MTTPFDTDTRPMATERQLSYIRSLMDEVSTATDQPVLAQTADPSEMTRAEASALIDTLQRLRTSARQRQAEATPELESGMYTTEGHVYKVYRSVHGSGRMLAKELDARTSRITGKPVWLYRGLASRFVSAADQMSREKAKELGHIYGVCVACGRTLTDEKSVEAGIGPICAGRL